MLIHISLVVALCSGLSMGKVKERLNALETANPGAKVTLRIDKKAQCGPDGSVLAKVRAKKEVENE